MKHTPLRSCIVCRQRKQKEELLRVVRTPDGKFVLDNDGRTAGRGAYVCASRECTEAAVKRKTFDRAFKQRLDDGVYAELEQILRRGEQ